MIKGVVLKKSISHTFLILLCSSTPSYAYLDPGAGSVFLQILLGGVAGLVIIGKIYWSRIRGFFKRLK